jgi:hypothetical protein
VHTRQKFIKVIEYSTDNVWDYYQMASHFKWYPASEEVVVPWNARYSFPSQSNKAVKTTPRISPKTGSLFVPNTTIRVEFPAQGYVSPGNTTLEFDLDLSGYGTVADSWTRLQNGVASVFSRIRLMYGSTPLEDIIQSNVIMRMLNESTASSDQILDQASISDGLGGTIGGTGFTTFRKNIRQRYIQGVSADPVVATSTTWDQCGSVPCLYNEAQSTYTGYAATSRRRYQIQFPLGLFTQEKLIPTKFMASQLAIELTLAPEVSCIMSGKLTGSGSLPTYRILNVNLIPEVLEFDSSYDATFLKGLQEGGVPIKFSSWHTFLFSQGGGSTANLQIQERSRSVKAIFAVIRAAPDSLNNDSGAFFSSTIDNTVLNSYQFRIGARYFPASPVICSNQTTNFSNMNSGACEAFIELQKSLNTVGDYRLSTALNSTRWSMPYTPFAAPLPATASSANQADYQAEILSVLGDPIGIPIAHPNCGAIGSSCFIISTSLETSSGMEISGLNAEEQSDISLMLNWSGSQATAGTFNIEVYTYYDGMLILRENNVLELIQ